MKNSVTKNDRSKQRSAKNSNQNKLDRESTAKKKEIATERENEDAEKRNECDLGYAYLG